MAHDGRSRIISGSSTVDEAAISVARVDLIYRGLNVVLTAVENLCAPRVHRRFSTTNAEDARWGWHCRWQ